MKGIKGFTLIELIVVIAIIGVLSAVLVPQMIGYISESRLSTANANAKLAFENAATYCTQCEVKGSPVSDGDSVSVFLLKWSNHAPPSYSRDGHDLGNALRAMMGSDGNSCGYVSVQISESIPAYAMWAKTRDDKTVGHYPGEATTRGQYEIDG